MGGTNNTLHSESVFIASEVFPHTLPQSSLWACLWGKKYYPSSVFGATWL
jgi:hypothetical protein